MTASNLGLGLGAAAVSVVLFGVFSLPTKKYQTGDGVFFQWCMCTGIFLVGIITHLVQCGAEGVCPTFVPLASFGGFLWCTSNLLLVPIVDTVGIGICMMIWGMGTSQSAFRQAFHVAGERRDASIHCRFEQHPVLRCLQRVVGCSWKWLTYSASP